MVLKSGRINQATMQTVLQLIRRF